MFLRLKTLGLMICVVTTLSSPAVANQDPQDRLATTCSSCHPQNSGLNSFLTTSFSNSTAFEPNTTYRLTVTLPAQSDQFGISVDVDEIVDGVTQSQNDGEFVSSLDNVSLISSIAYVVGMPAALTREVGSGSFRGSVGTTHQAGQPVTQDFFWRSPPANSALDGVRFRIQVVAGGEEGQAKRYALQTLSLGVVNSNSDGGDNGGPPLDDSGVDSNSSGSGGSFGGSFGCASLRTKDDSNKSHERVLDLGFLFLLFLSFVAAFRGSGATKSSKIKESADTF